jgi:hypothetical protein
MIKLLVLLALIACAHKEGPLSGARVKAKTFSSPKEANNYIVNKRNYIALLFEQSYDPYFATAKWSDECLARNTFGQVEEKNGHTYLVTQLILGPEDEPGLCEGEAFDVIWLHCKDENTVNEIICPANSCKNLPDKNPCPINF